MLLQRQREMIMKMWLPTLLGLLLVEVSYANNGYKMFIGEHCPGNVIKTFHPVHTAHACALKCDRTHGCISFTYGKKICYLQHKCVKLIKYPSFNLYVKIVPGYSMHIGRDCGGNDIRHHGSIHTPEVCAGICERTPQCIAFAWGVNKDCWVKHKCFHLKPNHHVISFVKEVPGYTTKSGANCPHHDIKVLNHISTPERCATSCDGTPGCNAFVHNSAQQCLLKPKCFSTFPDHHTSTYIKKAPGYTLSYRTEGPENVIRVMVNTPNAKVCAKICDHTSGCVAAVYSFGKKCWLKQKRLNPYKVLVKEVQGYTMRIGTDCPHNNIANHLNIPSTEACAAKCKSTHGCVAFTYTVWKQCFLKNQCFNTNVNHFLTTYVKQVNGFDTIHTKVRRYKQFTDVDCPGNDISYHHNTANAEICAAKCDANSECIAILYNTNSKVCWLKRKCTPTTPLRFHSAYLKEVPSYTMKIATDCLGNNIRTYSHIHSPAACAARCSETHGCVAFVHNENKHCWLKGFCMNTIFHRFTSVYFRNVHGYNLEIGADCFGNDIRVYTHTPSAAVCAKKCDHTHGCVAVVYSVRKNCYLKRKCSQTSPKRTTTTYIKKG